MTTCTPITKKCPPAETGSDGNATYAPFDVCVGNGTLNYDGKGLTYAPAQSRVSDGTYTSVTLANGCIVAAGQAPVAGYTPSECCGPPGFTTGTGTGPGASGVVLDPSVTNLATQTAAGVMVALHVSAEDGVTVTGTGTARNPLTIGLTAPAEAGVHAMSPTGTVVVAGTGEALHPLQLDLKKVGTAGTYNGLQVDDYGRVVDYDAPATTGVTAVVAGHGVAVTPLGATGTFQIALDGAALMEAGRFYAPASPDGTVPARIVSYGPTGLITSVVPA